MLAQTQLEVNRQLQDEHSTYKQNAMAGTRDALREAIEKRDAQHVQEIEDLCETLPWLPPR